MLPQRSHTKTQLEKKDSCGALIASMSDIGGHLARIEFECACCAPTNVHYRIIGCKCAAIRCDRNFSCEATNEKQSIQRIEKLCILFIIIECGVFAQLSAIVPTIRFELTPL